MKKWMIASVIMATIWTFSLTDALAIRRAGGQGWDVGTMYGSLFNPSTIETLSGEVLSVEKFTPFRRMGYGYLVMLQTRNNVTSVHVGPGWYVTPLGFQVLPGDMLQVTGSRIEYQGSPAIMAMEVIKGDRVLKLRDAEGIPVWSSSGAPSE